MPDNGEAKMDDEGAGELLLGDSGRLAVAEVCCCCPCAADEPSASLTFTGTCDAGCDSVDDAAYTFTSFTAATVDCCRWEWAGASLPLGSWNIILTYVKSVDKWYAAVFGIQFNAVTRGYGGAERICDETLLDVNLQEVTVDITCSEGGAITGIFTLDGLDFSAGAGLNCSGCSVTVTLT